MQHEMYKSTGNASQLIWHSDGKSMERFQQSYK